MPIQHLEQSGHGVSGRVSRKSMNGKTRGVREQFAQGDGLTISGGIVGNLPGNKLCIHIRVQRQLLLLDLMEGAHRCDRFADGASLEEGIDANRRSSQLFHSESSRPLDHAVVDDRNTHARNMKLGHSRG